ncbi:MAG: response regulator transcription factor [Gammaproteobacteria bacterium]|jgi:two-component system, NarL family, response regulator LiaR|nr:response regulator transcription factor [Gammaproteobacteria bacterium]
MSKTLNIKGEQPIRLLTVDDHALVRRGICQFLQLQPDLLVVAEAETQDEALAKILQYKPAVVLVDLFLHQQLAGIDLTQSIRQQFPQVQVIILTSYHQDHLVLPALEAGAISYLLKDIQPEALVSAIRAAARGQATLSPVVATKLLHSRLRSGDTLSERETEILRFVASGCSNAEIADQLCIAIKTVRTHVSNILSKLQLRDRTQAAVHAWKNGLM